VQGEQDSASSAAATPSALYLPFRLSTLVATFGRSKHLLFNLLRRKIAYFLPLFISWVFGLTLVGIL